MDVDAARVAVDAARRVVVLTGAGISTDSGIPDFRGPEGVWTKNPAAERAATLDHYVRDAELRRQAWARRVEQGPPPEPNAGHRALVRLEDSGRLHTLVTQNVDGLHLAAGTGPERLVEIHGTVRDAACLDCGSRWPMETVLDRVRDGEADPACQVCGGILKSATISFGQALVPEDLARAEAAAAQADLLLAVGSTLGVYPVANMVPMARGAGATVVIVNRGPTEMDDLAHIRLDGSISEILPLLVP